MFIILKIKHKTTIRYDATIHTCHSTSSASTMHRPEPAAASTNRFQPVLIQSRCAPHSRPISGHYAQSFALRRLSRTLFVSIHIYFSAVFRWYIVEFFTALQQTGVILCAATHCRNDHRDSRITFCGQLADQICWTSKKVLRTVKGLYGQVLWCT